MTAGEEDATPGPTDPNTVGASRGGGDAAIRSDDRTPGFRRDEVDAVGIPYHPVWSTFGMLLYGPVLWAAHFLLVYLAAEWACGQGGGADAAVTWTVWPTVLFGLAIVAGTAVTFTRYRDAQDRSYAFGPDETETTDVDPTVRDSLVLSIGLMLGVLSLVAVVTVGVTALVVPPC